MKLVDFGFAKIITEKSFTLCGTPEYLAPETIEHRGHGVTVDWWALGILVHEMLIGNPPFFDDNPYNLYQKILKCQFTLPDFLHRHASSVIRALLNPDPSQRLGSRVTATQGDADALKAEKWFRGVDFDMVESREIPAPWVPEIDREDDVSNYDEYPDSGPPELPRLPSSGDPFLDF